jgi:PAS domain S-box-containing protein
MRIKTKLRLGTGFLFIVIVIFGIISIVTINYLKKDSARILENNFESLVYSNKMLEALDKTKQDTAFLTMFENNLRKQQANITETGELEVTDKVSEDFGLLKMLPGNDSVKALIRQGLYKIDSINQQAILRKNTLAASTAEKANTWLMVIFSILILITFTIAVNFPSVATPITTLTDGIRSIVNKDYSRRIHLNQNNEFGELASAFNAMAEKLDEYEHSNLAQIKFEKTRIETIINQMQDGIIGLDDKNNILFLNAVAQQLLGVKEADVSGKYAPDVALTNDLMRNVLQDSNHQKEMKIFADRKESYFQLNVLHVRNDRQAIGQVIILRNITPFHELNEAKTNFIATVSHELKTPIAAIKISTQLLNDPRVGNINPEQLDLVNSINDDANRLLKITTELLHMTQVETGKIQLRIESVSCRDIVNEAVHSVQYILQQKGITLRQELSNELPQVMADQEKTSWVLINFLTNAIKHSLPASEIEISVQEVGKRVQFKIKDFGKGMEEKYLTRIFDRYYKIPGRTPGSGLGLTISKEFIEGQNGHVWVESMLGVGSTFGFDLPSTG